MTTTTTNPAEDIAKLVLAVHDDDGRETLRLTRAIMETSGLVALVVDVCMLLNNLGAHQYGEHWRDVLTGTLHELELADAEADVLAVHEDDVLGDDDA